MPIADLIYAGLELMVMGMGIVYGFLILLVFVLKAMSRLSQMIERPDEEATQLARPMSVGTVDQVPIPVIAAAIARFRAGRTR